MTGSRKTRVAVVFGGRSTEHAISCVSAGSILGALDPDEYEVVPVGITREGRWVLTSGDPAQLAIDGPPAARDHRRLRRRPSCCPPTRPASGLIVLDPADGRPRARPASTWSSRRCTAPTARTAPSRACWRWPACRTSAPTSSPPPPPWTRSSPRSSPPPRASRSGRTPCCAPGMTLTEADKERLGLPVFVKPSRAGSSYGITKVTDWADLDAAVAAARADRPEGAGRGRDRRPRDRVRGAGGRGRRRAGGVRCWPRSGSSPDHEFYDFEAKYLDDVVRVRHPGRPARAGDPAGPGVRRAARSPRWTAPAWPGSTSSSPRSWTSTSTRSTRCRASRRRRCSRGCGRPPAWSTRSWSTA